MFGLYVGVRGAWAGRWTRDFGLGLVCMKLVLVREGLEGRRSAATIPETVN